MRKIRVLHFTPGLRRGGAETMLLRLVLGMDRDAFDPSVLVMTDVGPIGEELRAAGIRVDALGISSRAPNPIELPRLVARLRRDPPDVLQTWMHLADLVGGAAARLARRDIGVAWGVHMGFMDRTSGRRTAALVRLCSLSSRILPDRIICCSESARTAHEGAGYDRARMVVIPNGTDVAAFHPDPAARPSVRRELGVSDDAFLIGLVGRFHPHKDHATFARAAALLHARHPEVHFLVCGVDLTWDNPVLAGWLDAGVGREHCHLLGCRDDVPRLTAALDVASSSSSFETFPLVIGEAMATGVPCVVTDAGESAKIVGDTGRVVPTRDPEALAAAWSEMIALSAEGRRALGAAARRRIEQNYQLKDMVTRYEEVYRALTARRRSH